MRHSSGRHPITGRCMRTCDPRRERDARKHHVRTSHQSATKGSPALRNTHTRTRTTPQSTSTTASSRARARSADGVDDGTASAPSGTGVGMLVCPSPSGADDGPRRCISRARWPERAPATTRNAMPALASKGRPNSITISTDADMMRTERSQRARCTRQKQITQENGPSPERTQARIPGRRMGRTDACHESVPSTRLPDSSAGMHS